MEIEANLKRAERLRQTILAEAFAGRLVPQHPDDEPASILLERIRMERDRMQKKGKAVTTRAIRMPDEPVRSMQREWSRWRCGRALEDRERGVFQ